MEIESIVEANSNPDYEFYDNPMRCFLYNWNCGAWRVGRVERPCDSECGEYRIDFQLCIPDGFNRIVEVDPQYIADWS